MGTNSNKSYKINKSNGITKKQTNKQINKQKEMNEKKVEQRKIYFKHN